MIFYMLQSKNFNFMFTLRKTALENTNKKLSSHQKISNDCMQLFSIRKLLVAFKIKQYLNTSTSSAIVVGKTSGSFKKKDLTLSKDASGREYVSVSHQRQTKNHRGDVHDKDQKQGRMYDKPGKNF